MFLTINTLFCKYYTAGKYMFEAYPETLAAYNSLFGAIAGIYNGGSLFNLLELR